MGQTIHSSYLGDDARLLISSPGGDTGGGLFLYDGGEVVCVDTMSSTGLFASGGQVARLIRSFDAGDASGELLYDNAAGELIIYDATGVVHYHRLDGVSDAHDVLWNGDHYVIVSTESNTIYWISPTGETVRTWRAPGEDDSWHLNSLLSLDGGLFVSAFGEFARHRQWNEDRQAATGIVFDLETGTPALTGLAQPHHPRFIDGLWVVCNSATRELLAINPETKVIERRLELAGFTRGVAVSDPYIFVGESAQRRGSLHEQHASIAVVCRSTWSVLDRFTVPCGEIYDLVIVDRSLARGVQRGSATNSLRLMEASQHALFRDEGIAPIRLWAKSDPLPQNGCSVRVDAGVPTTMEAGATVDIACSIENRAGVFLVSAPPFPVHLGYRWFDAATNRPVAEESWGRARLPHTIAPGERFIATVRAVAPYWDGTLDLRVTLVQESVMWFDDVDPANADIHAVRIVTPHDAGEGVMLPYAGQMAPAATDRVRETSPKTAAMLAEKDRYIESLESTLERERRAGEEHRASLDTALAAKDDYIASLLAAMLRGAGQIAVQQEAVAAALAEKDAFIATLISGRERERHDHEDYRAAMDATLAEKDTSITDLTATLHVSIQHAIAQQAAVAAILAEKDDYIVSLETTLERERRAGEEHRASLDTALAAKDDYIANLLAAQSSP